MLDYEKEREVTRIPVGDHPQRMRMGVIRREFLSGADGPPTHGDQFGSKEDGGEGAVAGVGAGGGDDSGPSLPATGYGLTFAAALCLAAGAILAGRLR